MREKRGIAGVRGLDPVQAKASLKIRTRPGGEPTEDGVWHIVVPRTADRMCVHHPQFADFNILPSQCPKETQNPTAYRAFRDKIDKRQLLRGNIVHFHEKDAWEYQLSAMVLGGKWPVPPGKRRPACSGDGKKALRFVGPDLNDFQEIDCPNENCEFRKKVGNIPPACQPWMRIIFRLRWSDDSPLPSVITKFQSSSWETVRGFIGLFNMVRDVAKGIGIEGEPNLMGLPFTMLRVDRTKPEQRFKYPVVIPSFDCDIVEFLEMSKQRKIAMENPVPSIEHMKDTLIDDMKDIRPGFGE